jgi:hypothetical protein
LEGCHLVEKLERMLPEHARPYLKSGIFGDADAASSLAARAGEYRGYVALAAYWCGTGFDAYREILGTAWELSHGSMLNAARERCGLIRLMFRAARFEIPVADRVKVYRGVAGGGPRIAAKGLSWSLSREIACWFAHRAAIGGKAPLVVTGEVDASEIIYHSDERSEAEVILRHALAPSVDADPGSWEAAAVRHEWRLHDQLRAQLRVLGAHGSPGGVAVPQLG